MQTIAMVVPVPVMVLPDRIVFGTHRGSTFDRAVRDQAISVQTEGVEHGTDVADMFWSIVVSGVCGQELDPDVDLTQLAEAGGWSAGRYRLNCVPFCVVQGWRAPLSPHHRQGQGGEHDPCGQG
jgi:hypothetical protein